MLIVSNYHYIKENFEFNYPSIFGLTPNQFNKQIIKLKEYGSFVSPYELELHLDEILKSDQIFILVTFDDGLKEQFELAKPILQREGIKAFYFVNTANVEEGKVSLVHKIHLLRSEVSSQELLKIIASNYENIRLNEREKKESVKHYNYDDITTANLKYLINFKLDIHQQSIVINNMFNALFDEKRVNELLYMNEVQLKVLGKEKSLGSHSHSHIPLGLQAADTINKDIRLSKQILERITNTDINAISYPYGNKESYSDPVTKLCEKNNFKLGFTMQRGVNYNNQFALTLKRFDCNDLPLGKNEDLFLNEYSTIYK